MIVTTTLAVEDRQTEVSCGISRGEAIDMESAPRYRFCGIERHAAKRAVLESAANTVVVDYDAMNATCHVLATGTAVRLG
ncbi:hypothetical protein SAMN04488094_10558 [Tropicimonas isoalkanivorans]|uniref:Uncharacterized protein n=1 Tax=Tropicimonas isoalkanivorans TaxID=441112 RepID=A0A1I1JC17_9RHOB|nr:hypothetical protein SAMN04488094_10558 [Tropicimonas isoalkanivorans]